MSVHSLFSRFWHFPIPNRPAVTLVALIALAWIGGLTVTSAQNSQTSIAPTLCNGKAFLPGEISFSGDVLAVETKSFTCTPVQLFKSSDKVPAILEIGQGKSTLWSVSKYSLQVGTNQVAYPIAAMVTSSDGVGHGVVPAVLKAKTDIKAGEKLRSDGYQIQAKRTVKGGDSIPALLVIGSGAYSLLSIEAASDGKPWFAVFKDDMKPDARVSAIETWRIAKQHVPFDASAPCGK